MLSSYNLKNKQTIQISGLILQYCSATTLYRRLGIRQISRNVCPSICRFVLLSVPLSPCLFAGRYIFKYRPEKTKTDKFIAKQYINQTDKNIQIGFSKLELALLADWLSSRC